MIPINTTRQIQTYKARVLGLAAAKAIADYHAGFDHIDSKLAILEAKITILQWVMGLALAGIISLVIKTFA